MTADQQSPRPQISAENLDAGGAFASKRSSKRLVCAFVSTITPGIGHWLLGDKTSGMAFLIAYFALIILWWPVRLARWYWGWALLLAAGLALFVAAPWSALRTDGRVAPPRSHLWLLMLIPIAVLALCLEWNLLLRAAGFRLWDIPSTAMETTVEKGDHILADHWYYRSRTPKRGDIVLYRRDGVTYVKRVIATGGNTIEGKAGAVFVDGGLLSEPYARHVGNAPPRLNDFGPFLVPTGKLFVIGDNRDVSFDSRMAGPIDAGSVVGKALYIYRSERDRTGKRLY
jgi:signal peptidase I